MADAMSGGFDPQSMMPMLMMALTSGQSGGVPSGIANYTPRFMNPNLGPPSTMGLPGMMSQFGEMGSSLGMLGMMGGYTFMPELMQRLQANANVDPRALRQQHVMGQTMLRYMSTNGQSIAESLGHPELGGALSSAMPFISQLPGMQSMIGALTPNQITSFGAQSIAHTAMMMDATGTLRSGNVDALERARKRLTENNGMRNMSFMSGFTQDEFASIGVFARDQGFDAQDVDRTAIRAAERDRQLKTRFKGRKESDLTTAEKADLEFETQRGTRAELQERSTGLAADVIRTTMSSLGVDRETAMVFGQQAGFNAHSQDEANNIKKAMRELEGFSKAAQVGGQEILNLAKALQAQNGGGTLFNTAVASMTALTSRFLNGASRDKNLHGEGNTESMATDITNVQEAFAQSGYAETLVSMSDMSTPFRKRIADLTKAGDFKGAQKLLNDSIRGQGEFADIAKLAGQRNLSPQDLDKGLTRFTTDVGIDGTGAFTFGVVNAEMEERLQSDPRLKGYFAASEETRDKIDDFVSQNATDEDMIAAGVDINIARAAATVAKDSANLGTGRTYFATRQGMRALEKTKRVRNDLASQSARIEEAKKRRQQAGAGQGLIPNLAKGNVKSLGDAFEAMGYLMSQEEASFMSSFNEEDKNEFIAANDARVKSMAVLSDEKSSEEDKKKAKEALRAAIDTNSGYGFDERDEKVRKMLGMAPGVQAVNGNDIQGSEGAGVKKADKPETGAPATNGATAAGRPQEVTVKTDARLELDIKINGQSLPITDFAGKVSEGSGFRDIAINGKRISGDSP